MLARVFSQHHAAVESLRKQWNVVQHIADEVWDCIRSGSTVYLCGNGGSAADCQHLAAELVGRYVVERPGFRAVALTTDSSILTAIGNDYGFEQVFSRQVEALVQDTDVLLCISTSGNSANVVNAAQQAREAGAVVIALTGRGPNKLTKLAHHSLQIDSTVTARVQEAHILAAHLICELIDLEYTGENDLDQRLL